MGSSAFANPTTCFQHGARRKDVVDQVLIVLLQFHVLVVRSGPHVHQRNHLREIWRRLYVHRQQSRQPTRTITHTRDCRVYYRISRVSRCRQRKPMSADLLHKHHGGRHFDWCHCDYLGCSLQVLGNTMADKALDRAVNNYNTTVGSRKMMDWIQGKLKCCGRNGPGDYKNTTMTCKSEPGQGVASCHETSKCSGELYLRGCKNAFIAFIRKNLLIVTIVAAGVMLIQVIGIALSCSLIRALRLSSYQEL